MVGLLNPPPSTFTTEAPGVGVELPVAEAHKRCLNGKDPILLDDSRERTYASKMLGGNGLPPCGRPESNRHGAFRGLATSPHWDPSPARIPVPPRPPDAQRQPEGHSRALSGSGPGQVKAASRFSCRGFVGTNRKRLAQPGSHSSCSTSAPGPVAAGSGVFRSCGSLSVIGISVNSCDLAFSLRSRASGWLHGQRRSRRIAPCF